MHAIIVTSSSSASGGARQALYLARGLHERGHRVHFVAPAGSAILEQAAGLDCLHLPKGFAAAEKTLRALFADGTPTVLHAFHNRAVKMAAYFGTLWRLLRLPVACVAYRGVTSRPGNPLPYLLPGIRAYIANSRACAESLPLLWRKNRCRVVYNSLPEERLQPRHSPGETRAGLGIPAGQLVIGSVGNDNPQKGFPLLLRAYAKARAAMPPSTLVLVGASPERWLPLCRELGIAAHVRLIPYTNHVGDYVRAFDLFAFASSFIESLPNVLMEAIALGRPVVASRVGGVPELVPDRFLFPPENEAALCERLRTMANSPALLRMSADSLSPLKALFSTEERLLAVLDVYGAALREIPARAGEKRSGAAVLGGLAGKGELPGQSLPGSM